MYIISKQAVLYAILYVCLTKKPKILLFYTYKIPLFILKQKKKKKKKKKT
ncbi:hypothetical protein HanXRQr2_Chr02g0084481 [Helianthus annuus]|uniref:Uncharacterized protein n=1 Tax=Helianthus annuus TaxID=4232 RepID=A0A9K3JRQ2_HELAN|nr:hypothetical protein HanXRQr2_Chr02g0084481 [Helianthus annuus]